MLCKCSGKYIDIYFNLKITFRNFLNCFLQTKSLQLDHFEMEEECWWDRKKRVFQVQSENISLKDWIDMRESSSFTPHQHNANW